jgi:hypothetical protein
MFFNSLNNNDYRFTRRDQSCGRMILTQKRRIRKTCLFNSLDASISEKRIKNLGHFKGREKLFHCPANSWMEKFLRIYEGDKPLTDHWTNTARSFKGIPGLCDCSPGYMKETPRRRITVRSSLNEISANQLGGWGGVTPSAPTPFYSRARICKPFKEPRNQFPACRAGTTSLFDVPARQAT